MNEKRELTIDFEELKKQIIPILLKGNEVIISKKHTSKGDKVCIYEQRLKKVASFPISE